MEPVAVVALVWMLLPFVLAFLWFRARSSSRRSSQEAKALKERFAPVVSLDTEIACMRDKADAARRETAEVRST